MVEARKQIWAALSPLPKAKISMALSTMATPWLQLLTISLIARLSEALLTLSKMPFREVYSQELASLRNDSKS